MNWVQVQKPAEFQNLAVALYGTERNAQTGKLDLQPISHRPLRGTLLSPKHAYILDAHSELFVWIGTECDPLEQKVARALANKFRQAPSAAAGGAARPPWCQLVVMHQYCETASFRTKFSDMALPPLRYRLSAELAAQLRGLARLGGSREALEAHGCDVLQMRSTISKIFVRPRSTCTHHHLHHLLLLHHSD